MKRKVDTPTNRRGLSIAMSRYEIDALKILASKAGLSVNKFVKRCIAEAGPKLSGMQHAALPFYSKRVEVVDPFESEWELVD